MELRISRAAGFDTASQGVEVVERKGLGHPDTICDALADELGNALARFYQERFGCVLHYNVDKALLWAGAARPAFGGGEVLEPFEVFLAGRATLQFRGVSVPVEDLAQDCCRAWLRAHLHGLDPDRHARIHCLIRPTSPDLAELYLRGQATGGALANDTSCGVGYAPRSALERAVIDVERALNSVQTKQACPELGEDVKVMGLRDRGRARLTVACAFVDRFVADLDDYLGKRARLAERVRDAARGLAGEGDLAVAVNAADDPQAGSVYLTVTGTSAEAGDDGQAGRGNRANGLITPGRPMSVESVAGKNRVTHVGRLYNLAAPRIAEALVNELTEVAAAQCCLVSQIGRAVDDPQVADVRVETTDDQLLGTLAPRIEEIVRSHLARLRDVSHGSEFSFEL